MIEKTINSIDDLLIFVKELNKKHNQRIWYRGVANSKWDLIPSIQRTKDRVKKEQFITNDFYIKAKQVLERCPEKNNYAAWMSLMQHFGLPTRLLDWSQSPLVAAYFATEKYMEHYQADACIWVLAPGLLNKEEGFGDCIYPVDAYTAQQMLMPAFKDKGYDEQFSDKILACHSVENNLRMYSQQANFTIHNTSRKIDNILNSDMLYKMIIPNAAREYFLYSLRVFGITESFIYPDLDHISNDLKRIYGLE